MPAARVKGIKTHRCLLLLAAGDMEKMNDQLCGPIVKDVEEGQLPIKPWGLVSFSTRPPSPSVASVKPFSLPCKNGQDHRPPSPTDLTEESI